jgi:hypothetical protein
MCKRVSGIFSLYVNLIKVDGWDRSYNLCVAASNMLFFTLSSQV